MPAVFWVIVQQVCSISLPLSLALSVSSPAQSSLSYQGHLGASQLSDISRIYLSVCRVKLQYQHNSSRHLVFSLIPAGLSVVIRLFINGCWTGQARPHPHDLSRTFLQSCNKPLTWMGLNQADIEKVRVQL